MSDEDSESSDWRINRRTVLRSAIASSTGLIGASAFGGTAAARGGPPDDGGSPPEDRGGQPCHTDFSCDGTYVKYEVVERDDGTCYLNEETDTGIYAGSLTIADEKDGDSCEPIKVTWDSTYWATGKLMAFGGQDCDIVPDPGESYDARGEGEAGLDNPGGNTAAISNLQFCVEPREPEPEPELECPDGTSSLARYSVSGGSIEFEDGVDVVRFSNTVTKTDGLKAFDFSSVDDPDDSNEATETLTTVTVKCGSTVLTSEVDPDFTVDKRSGSVDVTGSDCGITEILFCQAAYAEVDFVKGNILKSLCENSHGSDKISSITWSSYNGQLNGKQGQFDGSWEIDNDNGTVTVHYEDTPAGDDYNGKVSLGVYRVEDPTFQENTNIDFGETRCRHTLLDDVSDKDSSGGGSLTLDLPSP